MTGAALALLALLPLAQAQETPARADVDLKGRLYKAVFYSGPGTLSSADLTAVPDALRQRLSRFLERRAGFESRYTHEAGSFDEVRVDARKREIERAIVALVEAPDVERLALEFLNSVNIALKWEGHPDGPLSEAAGAEDFLKRNPATPVAPYVYVFIAHRQRAAFETYDSAKNVDGMKAASRKYRTFMQRARSVPDPIFPLVADDLDRQPHVYVKTGQHPASFDPDA